MTQDFTLKICAYLMTTVCIAGCTLTPELPTGGRVATSDDADLQWPTLLPSNSLPSVPSEQDPRIAELDEETQAILKRAEALRAKAAGLNGPILTQQERNALTQNAP